MHLEFNLWSKIYKLSTIITLSNNQIGSSSLTYILITYSYLSISQRYIIVISMPLGCFPVDLIPYISQLLLKIFYVLICSTYSLKFQNATPNIRWYILHGAQISAVKSYIHSVGDISSYLKWKGWLLDLIIKL